MSGPIGGHGPDFFNEVFGSRLSSVDRVTGLMIETLRGSCTNAEITRLAFDAKFSEESPIEVAISSILERAPIESVQGYLKRRLDELNTIDPATAWPEVKEVIELAKRLGCFFKNLKLNELNPDLVAKISEEIVNLAILENVLKHSITAEEIDPEVITEIFLIMAAEEDFSVLRSLFQKIPQEKITEAVCLALVSKDWEAYEHLPQEKMTEAICLAGVRKNWRAITVIPKEKMTEAACIAAVNQYYQVIKMIPEEKMTEAVCIAAVQKDLAAIEWIPEEKMTDVVCLAAVMQHPSAIYYLPKDKQTEALCLAAVKQNGGALLFIEEDKRTEAVCLAALKQSSGCFRLVPPQKENGPVLECLKPIFCEKVKADPKIALLQPLLLGDPDFISAFFKADISSLDPNSLKELQDRIGEACQDNQELLRFIPDEYKELKPVAPSHFPRRIGSEIKAISSTSPEGASIDSLFLKLLSYAEIAKPDSLDSISQAAERIAFNIPFLGTPKAEEKQILDAWYEQIKLLLTRLDSVIDPDPSKDTEVKEDLIEAFGVCGGGWQAHFEQMNSKLVAFRGASPKAMLGIVVKRLIDEIVNEIHIEYSASIGKNLNVHDLNVIRNILKDYLPEVVLPDHLGHINWPAKQVKHKFLQRFTGENIIKEILSEYQKEDSALKEALATLYQEEIFQGCDSSMEIDRKIGEQRDRLEFLLEEFPSKLESYNAIISKIKEEDRAAVIQHFNQIGGSAAMLKAKIRKPQYNAFIDENIGAIFAFKGIQIEISQLINIPQAEVLTKSQAEIRRAFEEACQSKVEAFVAEEFASLHVKDGIIKESGIRIIAEKLGLVALKSWLGMEDLPPSVQGGAGAPAGSALF